MTAPFLSLFLLAGAAPLSAGVALLVAEPFGKFGMFNPTGHAAIYLSGVCAETPTKLRLCRPGEDGVVISRYNRIGGYDWIAVPLLPYLYAVERPEEVPASADARVVTELRDAYRRRHLREIAPDGPQGEMPNGDWIQMVGAAYDRTFYGFALPTSPEEDARLVERLNTHPNKRRFNIFYRNCADFARNIVNFYHPKALRRNIIADLGITTPKQSAKSMVSYGRKEELPLSHFAIMQVPGMGRSTNVRGVSESLVRSKKYAVPLIVLQPWVAGTAAVAYLVQGRFNPARRCPTVCEPAGLANCLATAEGAECGGAAEAVEGDQAEAAAATM
jgi:hypothetical protein